MSTRSTPPFAEGTSTVQVLANRSGEPAITEVRRRRGLAHLDAQEGAHREDRHAPEDEHPTSRLVSSANPSWKTIRAANVERPIRYSTVARKEFEVQRRPSGR